MTGMIPRTPTAIERFRHKMLNRLVCLDMLDTTMVGVLLGQDDTHYLVAEDDSGSEILVNVRDVRAAWIMTSEDIRLRRELKEAK